MLSEPVKLVLDKERHLRLTLRGMLAYEKESGKNLLKGFRISDLGLKDIAALLWACLLSEDKELTADEVLDLVDILPHGESILIITLYLAVTNSLVDVNVNNHSASSCLTRCT